MAADRDTRAARELIFWQEENAQSHLAYLEPKRIRVQDEIDTLNKSNQPPSINLERKLSSILRYIAFYNAKMKHAKEMLAKLTYNGHIIPPPLSDVPSINGHMMNYTHDESMKPSFGGRRRRSRGRKSRKSRRRHH